MTTILIKKTSSGEFRGFTCIGHTGYAKSGEDIVCASVSVLVINTINAMEILAKQKMQIVSNEEEGLIDCSIEINPNEKSILLLDAMVLGLKEIKKEYKNFIELKFEEV